MTDARHLTWGNLNTLLLGDAPVRVPIDGNPPLQLLFDTSIPSWSLLIPWSNAEALPISSLAEIHVSLKEIDGKFFVLLSASQKRLFKEAFSLFLDIADEIQVRKRTPVQALNETLAAWKDLLKQIPILSIESQLGLLGELWIARRLIRGRGVEVSDGWIGPLKENHDFRIQGVDIEVKTTTRRDRVHFISELTQLVPSQHHRLFLLSLQVQPAGSGTGFSIADSVQRIKDLLKNDSTRLDQFDERLSSLGYEPADEVYYRTKYKMRSPPMLIAVDEKFPAITIPRLEAALNEEALSRIMGVQYQVDVEGLGVEDNKPPFLEILPRIEEDLR